ETTLYICDIENDYFKMHDFSKKVLNKAISYQAGEIYDNTDHFVISKNYNCPSNYSLLEVDGAIFSSLKQATNDNDLILRLYNPYRDKDINFKTNIDKLDFVKADETSKDQANNFIRPCGIKTIKIKNQ
ncbi:MAG: glycosyl hydrolase-related protein, partial [Anaerococcus sp.]|nr:glycosyl hydrolase-related protein [Anaerococcus sp.]